MGQGERAVSAAVSGLCSSRAVGELDHGRVLLPSEAETRPACLGTAGLWSLPSLPLTVVSLVVGGDDLDEVLIQPRAHLLRHELHLTPHGAHGSQSRRLSLRRQPACVMGGWADVPDEDMCTYTLPWSNPSDWLAGRMPTTYLVVERVDPSRVLGAEGDVVDRVAHVEA